jgi:ABC-2 type transport system ATP-binding protein
MKRRVNLAVGLLNDPPLLVLDEPTVGIDPQSREKIFEMVGGLRLAGKTILYTTHYMEEAQRLCSRLVVLDEGEVLAEGTVAEILEGGEGDEPCVNLEERFIALTGKRLRD